MLASKQFSSTWIPPDSRLQQFWDLLRVFDAICSWVRVGASLDSVRNGTQEVERSGRRSCCPSSLALAFLIKSCLAHLVMSACPQMIITPSLDALVSFEKFRTISLPFISLKSGITKPPRHSCTVVLHSPRLALLQSTDAWFDTRFIQKS